MVILGVAADQNTNKLEATDVGSVKYEVHSGGRTFHGQD